MKRKCSVANLKDRKSGRNKKERIGLNDQNMVFMGHVPFISIPKNTKKVPNAALINEVKQIVMTGVITQKQLAYECGIRYAVN